MAKARFIRPAKIPQRNTASGYEPTYTDYSPQFYSGEAALNYNPELAPVGPIEKVPDEKMNDLGLTSVYQSDPQKIVSMKMPMHVHKRAGKWLDNLLGKPTPIKLAKQNMNMEQRPGEGKWLKNLIDKHNRKLKKDFRKVEFDNTNVYIYVLEHSDLIDKESNECLITMHTIGKSVNSIKIMLSAEVRDTLTKEISSLQNMIDKKYITVNKIEVITAYKIPYN